MNTTPQPSPLHPAPARHDTPRAAPRDVRSPDLRPPERRPRDLRPLWRGVLAVLLPLGPLAVAVSFALRPFGPYDEPAVIVAKILASPWTDLLLWLGFLAPGLLLLAPSSPGTWPGGAPRCSPPRPRRSTRSRSA